MEENFILTQRDFDDFERGDDRTYIIGNEPNVLPKNPEHIGTGELTRYLIRTETLQILPAYVRVESDIRWRGETKPESRNTWFLDYVEIRINPEKENITYSALDENDSENYIKLGLFDGRFLYLAPSPTLKSTNRKQTKVKGKGKKKTYSRK